MVKPPMSESDLVRALALGRPEAFEEIVERYEKPLINFIVKYVDDRAAAEDVFQETFVRVVRSIGDYEPRAGLATWIFTIARNLSLDHLRSRKRRREAPIDGTNVIAMPAAAPAPDAREEAERVREAVQRLSPPKREAVVLRFFSGLSYEEIGRMVGAPTGTIKFRVHEAMRDLAALLKRDQGGYAHDVQGSA